MIANDPTLLVCTACLALVITTTRPGWNISGVRAPVITTTPMRERRQAALPWSSTGCCLTPMA